MPEATPPPHQFLSTSSPSSLHYWITRLILTLATAILLTACQPQGDDSVERQQILWGTSAVGSSGHRALVNLAAVLNRELEDIQITVLPMPGAIMGMRQYTAGDLDGYYGSDIAFYEMASASNRFEGFQAPAHRPPLQSFWAYTMETGFAIRREDVGHLQSWSDLSEKTVFTGPLPWDTRAHLERLLATIGVSHRYVELDLGMAGSQLRSGGIDAIGIYTTGERDVAPWVAEAELVADLAILNPSAGEQASIRAAGMELVSVPPTVFQNDVQVEEVILSPFYYGFHLGKEFSEETVYRMLTTIEEYAEELAGADSVFSQIVKDMPGLQQLGVARSVGDTKVHPGLARYMRERGVWNANWDSRVADVSSDP